MNKLLDELEALEAKATKGPWHLTFEKEEGFPCLFTDEAKTLDVTIGDLNLIDKLRNSARDLLSALRAAEKWLEADDAANDRNNYPLSPKGPDYPARASGARERFRDEIGRVVARLKPPHSGESKDG